MNRPDIFVSVIRHGEFEGPGAGHPNYRNFRASLGPESRGYPLTENGSNVARIVADGIPVLGSEVVITSGYLRTHQTGHIVADVIGRKTGVRVPVAHTRLLDPVCMPTHSLSETDYYRFLNQGKGGVAERMFELWADGIGETPLQVRFRIDRLLSGVNRAVERGYNPIIVTHASFAGAMYRRLNGVGITRPRDENQILTTCGSYKLVVRTGKPVGLESYSNQFLS